MPFRVLTRRRYVRGFIFKKVSASVNIALKDYENDVNHTDCITVENDEVFFLNCQYLYIKLNYKAWNFFTELWAHSATL